MRYGGSKGSSPPSWPLGLRAPVLYAFHVCGPRVEHPDARQDRLADIFMELWGCFLEPDYPRPSIAVALNQLVDALTEVRLVVVNLVLQHAPPLALRMVVAAAARCGNRVFGDQPSRRRG